MISKQEVENLYRECIKIYSEGGSPAVWRYLEEKKFPYTGMCIKCEGIRHVDPYDNSCMACGQLAPEMCVVELTQKERRVVQFALNNLILQLDEGDSEILDDPAFGLKRDEMTLLREKFNP